MQMLKERSFVNDLFFLLRLLWVHRHLMGGWVGLPVGWDQAERSNDESPIKRGLRSGSQRGLHAGVTQEA